MRPSAEASPWALVEGFKNCLGNAHLFEIGIEGQRVLIALRGSELEGGRLLDVVGMRSLGDRARPHQVLPVIEALARQVYQADLLSMCTRHPHLVRACVREGWTDVARIVNKPLRLQ
ncbi:MAG TPA: hypothetical protein VF522_13125 [Ramlibacter sp.]|uniref:hypothetical protein n=1 Tax=Ramlibacter sp. TaxID=1917967 RepID=UPI002ED65A9F